MSAVFVDISLVLDVLVEREIEKKHCGYASSNEQWLQLLSCNIRDESARFLSLEFKPSGSRRTHGIFWPGFIMAYLGSPTIVQWPNMAKSTAIPG